MLLSRARRLDLAPPPSQVAGPHPAPAHQAALSAPGQQQKKCARPTETLFGFGLQTPALEGKGKKNPLPAATSHLAPPAAPSHRSRRRCRGCRPGAPRRGIFAPRHCRERERDGREITARRDPRGGDTLHPTGRLTLARRCLRQP
ncbi:unnamed protein product [Rangifer tarandus platyrhynchus]|uniref:Uncharacterized protein n=2 Tax=Rangifer tarandus platyrhynchus TaxID=3082113 RepID=A0ABN8Y5J1_RANTA|nr:unnamed protein product [Rangifer tarandus platyrhynchus]CAI9693468.1 unnamed protein product [Rangifer tarandus platyrhynchus]